MAAPREIEVDCHGPVTTAAWQILQVRWEEARDLASAITADPPASAIHNMRVATRRLRSAMRDFRRLIKFKPMRGPMKEIGQLADALGAVRDQDVAIAALERFYGELKSEAGRDGLQQWKIGRIELRSSALNELKLLISVEAIADLDARFTAALEKATARSGEDAPNFADAGGAIIAKSYRQLTHLSRGLYAPHRRRPLHRMRIAAKRLRYALELFAICGGEEMESAARDVAEMQTRLGDLHDCDVWIDDLGPMMRLLDQRQALTKTLTEIEQNVLVASVWLLGRLTRDRAKHFRDALTLWHDWTDSGFGGRLDRLGLGGRRDDDGV
ncbi:MAG: CHAD domain-containing protein [Pyrinomonadaceae bacterium]